MRSWIGESYLSRLAQGDLPLIEERVRAAAERVSSAGSAVRYLRSLYLPGDETCFHFFRAASAEAVLAAGELASTSFDRVAEVLEQAAPAAPAEAIARSVDGTDRHPTAGRALERFSSARRATLGHRKEKEEDDGS